MRTEMTPNYHLRYDGDPILRTKCSEVEDFSGVDYLVNEMLRALKKTSAVGIAAPQIGDSRRIIIAKTFLFFGSNVLINPRIIDAKKEVSSIEGCLSVPGMFVHRERWDKITVEYFTPAGKKKIKRATGIYSKILQHEIDHLDGKLMYEDTFHPRKYNIKS